jgi:hypothetical protein
VRPAACEEGNERLLGSNAFSRYGKKGGDSGCAVPVLYLIVRFLVDLAVSRGSDRA